MNSFGVRFKFTSFGESHGQAIGCVVDGMPAGVKFDFDLLQEMLNKRKPGQNSFSTPRKEEDKAQVLSGVFEGYTTGAPISIIIMNENTRSKDYEKDVFRPAHADFTYYHKYGIRDYRGGGRSSARESAARVAAGALACMLLREFDIEVVSGVFGVGKIDSCLSSDEFDFDHAKNSEVFALDQNLEQGFKDEILKAKKAKNSIGARVFTRVKNPIKGLGEPLYDKLDSKLAHAIMGVNAVKAIEIGSGIQSTYMYGSENNDELKNDRFLSNHSGGVLGGISNGDFIDIKTYFKPTPSIFLPQQTQNIQGENIIYELKGRHDPCVGIRGSVVVNAMVAICIADALLLNASSNLNNLKQIYKKNK
ncbi:chorismate synthase [Campylobacter sp. 2014D-0216]|uniref:chorismate synthase n=1 Tax=Campylobacter sp. 2014D-0216 TaxID=1813595 RepID=UPI0018A3C027|nr:chorismate synthase [Campylobacter sp. 2014D-0216]QOR01114.1 chorismate synthase [Campylobacter sp. 2014D-0216]